MQTLSVLVNYTDKVKSLEGKLEGFQEKILSLEKYNGRLDRASEIECTLLYIKVKITCIIEEAKKEPTPRVAETLLMTGVSLP